MIHGASIIVRARGPGVCLDSPVTCSFSFCGGETGILVFASGDTPGHAVIWDSDTSRSIHHIFSDTLEIVGLEFCGKRLMLS